jgi:hypothetical protein
LDRGDFVRLRELGMSVELPSRMTRTLRARSATMNISARNLGLWSRFGGQDPESVTDAPSITSVGLGMPQARTWVLRFDLGL